MSLSKFSESTNNVSALPDKPTLTASQLKATFDKVGGDLKTYINNTLTTELDTVLATKVTSVSGSRLMTSAETTKLQGIETGATKIVIASGTAEPTSSTVADLYIQIIE